jgi:hypothetical protein
MELNRIEEEIGAHCSFNIACPAGLYISSYSALVGFLADTIKEIYGDTFERIKPKAWQAATFLPEFTIIVTPEDDSLAPHVSIKLHVKYSNTYPRAPAIFSFHDPKGISRAQLTTLAKLVRDKSLQLVGEVMVFDVSDPPRCLAVYRINYSCTLRFGFLSQSGSRRITHMQDARSRMVHLMGHQWYP